MAAVNIIAQPCSGSWALQRPLTSLCVVGQWVGWQNPGGNPSGCPINPVYTGVQTNTFTFSNPVSTFSIDFRGFDASPGCARIEIKINDVFYPLTTANFVDFPVGSICTIGAFANMEVTLNGYLTNSSTGGPGNTGQGRIIITNVNATNVSVSANDGSGTIFSDPFNCLPVVPLKLISFKVRSSLCKAQLNWETGAEQNVKSIEIQISRNGILFNKTGEIAPKGSNSLYSFETNSSSDTYFRLKINDLDDSYQYSEIVYLKSSCNNPIYTVSPNPASDMIEVSGLTNNDWLMLSDISGRIIRKFNFQQGDRFNIQNLATGMYIIQVINTGVVKEKFKLIKQ